MIYLKSPQEIAIMREGGIILGDLLEIVLPDYIKEGVSGSHIDKVCEDYVLARGAEPILKGYRVGGQVYRYSICFSMNNEVVHGLPTDSRVLKDGDLVGVDMSIRWKGYHLDKAVTYKVGNISKENENLVDVTKKSLDLALDCFVKGNRISDISNSIQRFVESNGMSIIRDFCGHGIGKNLHEDPEVLNYGEKDRGPLMEDGMTLAIEPMVALGDYHIFIEEDGWTASTLDGSNSAHFEETAALSKGLAHILTRPGGR